MSTVKTESNAPLESEIKASPSMELSQSSFINDHLLQESDENDRLSDPEPSVCPLTIADYRNEKDDSPSLT